MATVNSGHGKMLGRTWKPWKLSPGRKPCGCIDCDQIGWNTGGGKNKREGRRYLRRLDRRNFKQGLMNIEEA